MPALDVFKTTDAFSERSLTDSILKMPYAPGRVRELGLFQPQAVTTTTIMVEEKDGVLTLIPTSPRGGVGSEYVPNRRTARPFIIPHLEHNHTILADEVQNVRAWGSETELQALQALVNMRLAEMALSMDVTIEHMMVGALRGAVLDADGSSTIVNLFTEFGVSQEAEVAFNAASATLAALKASCNGIIRKIQDNLGATPMSGVHALCSPEFFDDFTGNAAVNESFVRWQGVAAMSGQIGGFSRESHVRQAPFHWGGIDWEEYRGSVGGVNFIPTDKVIFFPKGVPGLFKIYFAPADFAETVNTLGLPRYAKQFTDQELNRWVRLHTQSNPLPMCVRPKVLMKGKKGA